MRLFNKYATTMEYIKKISSVSVFLATLELFVSTETYVTF